MLAEIEIDIAVGCRKSPLTILSSTSCKKRKLEQSEMGIPFDVIEEDFDHLPLYCPIFPAIKLVYGYGRGGKRQNDASATLDRIDNATGYVRDNVLIISWRGNRLKNNSTPGELRSLAEFYSLGGSANTIMQVVKKSDHESPSPPTLPA